MNLSKLLSLGLALMAMHGSLARSPIPTIELKETEKTLESVVEMKGYYKNELTVFSLDHLEPAAKAVEIVFVAPQGEDEAGFPIRKTYSAGTFCNVQLSKTVSSYDSKLGLTLKIPVSFYNLDKGDCSVKDTLLINVKMNSKNSSSSVAWLKSGNRN